MNLATTAYNTVAQVLAEPTTHIRVLILQSGRKGDPIQCTTSVAALKEHPKHTALSYTWGDPNVVKEIDFNGCSGFKITENLHAALEHLRCDNRERRLWIDALCINQADDAEKNVQVGIMAQIYEKAAHTVIWLGAASDKSDLAMDTIAKLDGEDLESPANYLTAEQLESVIKLMQRPWWSRVWIIQEALFSDQLTVRCGDKSLPMEDFMKLDDIRRDYHRSSKTTMRSKNTIGTHSTALRNPFCDILTYWPESRKQVRKGGSSLSQWASYLKDFRATDPRDKIYAIVGLGNEDDKRAMKIGYQRAMTVNQVYHLASYWIIMSSRALLEWQRDQDNKAEFLPDFGEELPLPTFVTDYSDHPAENYPGWFRPFYVPFAFHDEYKATGDGKILGRFVEDPNPTPPHAKVPGIHLRGLLVDKIAFVAGNPHVRPYDGTEPVEKLRTRAKRYRETATNLEAWEEEFRKRWSTMPYQDEEADLVFLRTIMADRDAAGRKLPTATDDGLAELFAQLASLRSIPRDFLGDDHSPDLESLLASLETIARAMIPRTAGRNFFITEKGYVGLGPLKSQIGDGVYVLEGGLVPFVLRDVPKEELDSHNIETGQNQVYVRLVGESYVLGVSDGEWISKQNKDSIVEVVVC